MQSHTNVEYLMVLLSSMTVCMRATLRWIWSSPFQGCWAGGKSHQCTDSGAVPSGWHRLRFWYICSVKKGVKGDIT